ncbi:hypothetical protein MMC07_000913 [Pseudocyphellaria aurata]|nr:hypothetical protein [Pseudocyphellaria aurata]
MSMPIRRHIMTGITLDEQYLEEWTGHVSSSSTRSDAIRKESNKEENVDEDQDEEMEKAPAKQSASPQLQVAEKGAQLAHNGELHLESGRDEGKFAILA